MPSRSRKVESKLWLPETGRAGVQERLAAPGAKAGKSKEFIPWCDCAAVSSNVFYITTGRKGIVSIFITNDKC